tara:strand:- start:76 stop:1041 length:966 start_codon:yes stop_codon:yes gene_type:complete
MFMPNDDPKFWLFKAIPSRFNLEGCLENMDNLQDINWITWQFKDQEWKASEISKNDKFILWKSGSDGSVDGVVGYGKVVREYNHEKAPPHVSDFHLNTTYHNNEKIFRIRIEPEAWSVGNYILRAKILEKQDPLLSRKKLMPFDQQGSYPISKSQYENIVRIYENYHEGSEIDPVIGKISPLEKKSSRRGPSRSTKFRNGVRKAYRNKCAISGENNKNILEAAHIDGYRNSAPEHRYNDDISNGILLRIDIHKLFDTHYIAIKPPKNRVGMRVVVSEKIEGGKENDYYKKYHNKELKSKPIGPGEYPDFDALERRLERLKR